MSTTADTENNSGTLPIEWFLSTTGKHPLAMVSDKDLLDNAASIVTDEDRKTLMIDHPLSILNWVAKRCASVPRRSVQGPLNETVGPLVYHALIKVLRVKIKGLEPIEEVGRIRTLQVEPRGRPNIRVMIMVPFEHKLDSAWNLYHHAVRHLMNYLVEGDSRIVQRSDQWITFDFWGGRRRSQYIATIHRGEAARCFRAAMREMIQLSPDILSVGELTYILSRLVGRLNGLGADVHNTDLHELRRGTEVTVWPMV